MADGRNSSTAFALSSGTIGAALAACMSRAGPSAPSGLSQIPCLAISYGVVTRPVPARLFELAHDAAADVADRLWRDWGFEVDASGQKKRVALYTVNVPLTDAALEPKNRTTCWADFWQNDVRSALLILLPCTLTGSTDGSSSQWRRSPVSRSTSRAPPRHTVPLPPVQMHSRRHHRPSRATAGVRQRLNSSSSSSLRTYGRC